MLPIVLLNEVLKINSSNTNIVTVKATWFPKPLSLLKTLSIHRPFCSFRNHLVKQFERLIRRCPCILCTEMFPREGRYYCTAFMFGVWERIESFIIALYFPHFICVEFRFMDRPAYMLESTVSEGKQFTKIYRFILTKYIFTYFMFY